MVCDRILDGNNLQELKESNVPSSVTTLSLQTNGFTMLDMLSFRDSLVSLDLGGNTIQSLSNWDMPSGLQTFSCENCGVTEIAGVWFPSSKSLQSFDLAGSSLSMFEIANSSLELLEAVSELTVVTKFSTCSDTRAQHVTLPSTTISVCVLSDAVFSSKYASSSSKSTQGSNGSANAGNPAGSDGGGGLNKWMLLAIISVSVLLGVLLSGLGFVLYRRKQQRANADKADGANLDLMNHALGVNNQPSSKATTFFAGGASASNTLTRTARTESAGGTILANSTTEYLANDIRTDEEMQRFRLMQEEVELGALIAQGGYGAVYQATFRHETVVVKQLLPEKAKVKRTLMNFMDEIRLCATLDHPKIVQFLGVMWSSLLDVSMVMEYMPNGDLSSLLLAQLQREARDSRCRDAYSWFHSACDGNQLKCKSLIALDVAEALVYLHSFESPIIHRDLKPKNVLMSESWEAKLTDFGVSREMTEDQTMTGEIGTISWIAPEVLRGERYSEKADVYSFGVVLTELDTCRRPYSDGVPDDEHVGGKNQHTNTRIAVLVSNGNLRPTVHADCPRSVRALVDKCLAFDPTERPSAVQIHFELRNLELGDEELSASGLRLTRAMSTQARSQRGMSRC